MDEKQHFQLIKLSRQLFTLSTLNRFTLTTSLQFSTEMPQNLRISLSLKK